MTEKEFSFPSILKWISNGTVLVSGAAVLLCTLLITYDVLMRYFLNKPQLFVDELTSFLLVGIIFLGTGPTFYRGGHIRVDLVTNLLRPQTQSRLRIVTLSIGLVLLGIITHETFISALVAFQMGRVSAVMLYPIWIAMLLIPIGLGLMAFFMGVELVRQWRSKEGRETGPPDPESAGRSA
jgi:TRAP-type C4-dicarboxylate transport system permease small subunit